MSSASDFVIKKGILTKYKGAGGDVTVPVGVTGIGERAFYGCRSLTNITLPEGLTSIGDWAFYGCTSLTSITLPEGLTSIGDRAFYGCTSLTNIILPEGLTSIGDWAFRGCKSLADADGFVIIKGVLFDYFGPGGDVVVPEGVTSIGDWAFEGCRSLKSVALPDGLTSIGSYAFRGCTNLTSITLPQGLASLDEYAFEGCTQLVSITLPEGVTRIGDWVFCDCTRLTSVTIPRGVTSIGSQAFRGCTKLPSVTIPDSVTSIGNEAFLGCASLTSVTIPDGVTSIGDLAFADCKSLASVTISASVTSIGNEAFRGCGSIESINMTGCKARLNTNVFGYSEALPSGLVANIGLLYPHMSDSALKQYVLTTSSWKKLDPALRSEIFLSRQGKSLDPAYREIIDAEQMEPLGNAILKRLKGAKPGTKDCNAAAAFMTMFHSVAPAELHKSLYEGLKQCEAGTKAVRTVEVQVALMEKLGAAAEAENTLPQAKRRVMEPLVEENASDFVIENGVLKKYVGPGGDVTIPAGVNEIGENAFRDKKLITSISIPERVIHIGKMAFKGCIALERVFLSRGVKWIGNRAFMDCSTLKSICIPDSVKSMGNYAFANCTMLTDVTLPKETKRIEQRTFAGCSSLESIVLPENVSYIEPAAFNGCTSLRNISLPETLEKIDTSAFEQCTELKSVTLPEELTYIGNFAFLDSGLVSIVIPQSVKAIGVRAFAYTGAHVTILGKPRLEQDCITHAFLATQLPLSEISSPDLKRLAVVGWILSTENDPPVDKPVADSFRKYWRSHLDVFLPRITADDRFLPALMEKQLLTLDQTDALLDAFQENAEKTAMLLSYKHRHFDDKAIEKNEEKKTAKTWKAPTATELRQIWSPKDMPNGTLQLINYRGTDTEIVVPDTIGSKLVARIGDHCFSPGPHWHMKTTVTNRETRNNIKSVKIPEGIREIGFHAFGGCWYLQEVVLNEGLLYIGEDAFNMCFSLKTVVIPRSVKGIFIGAFQLCENLEHIFILSETTMIDVKQAQTLAPCSIDRRGRHSGKSIDSAFDDCPNLTIHAPAGSYAEQYAKEHGIPFVAE